MKARRYITLLGALSALAAAGTAFADPGIRDGSDPFRDFQSTKSRADVRSEFDAAKSGVLVKEGREIGARGPSGSRYSTLSRDDVKTELMQHKDASTAYSPSYLYFGD